MIDHKGAGWVVIVHFSQEGGGRGGGMVLEACNKHILRIAPVCPGWQAKSKKTYIRTYHMLITDTFSLAP